MELIPIIKYALTMISALAFIVIVISYIMYKVKNGGKSPADENSTQVINTLAHNAPAYPANVVLQPVHAEKEQAYYIREKNYQPRPKAVRKPVQRFMVINQPDERIMEERFIQNRNQNYVFEHPYSNNNFNIYSNYSVNSSEPLQRFGV